MQPERALPATQESSASLLLGSLQIDNVTLYDDMFDYIYLKKLHTLLNTG